MKRVNFISLGCSKNLVDTELLMKQFELAGYKIMVDSNTGTVWETIEGASAFNNAGSLCHGWSAIPIYYFDILGK